MFGLDLAPFEALSAYRARLLARPSWSRTLAGIQA